MKQKRMDNAVLVLTEEQWKAKVIRDCKRKVHDTLEKIACYAAICAIFLALPVGMLVHFFLSSGY